MSDAAEEKAPAAPAGIPMKMVIIIVAGVLVLALGGAFAMVKMMGAPPAEKAQGEGGSEKPAAHGEAEDKGGHGVAADAGTIADLDPFIVNLADTPEIRYLKVTLKVEADSSSTVEQIKARTPQIRDAILVLLTGLDSATARSPQGKHKLREDITDRINGLLPKKSVKSTYFTEFVIQ
ncbi:MAG: flagellar basal body-associated FliL family protein [Nitrospira sp.]|jgi:flagellar FliL protein|nr:flagellar basal body-associated FliL family protein [Nitrospira sp.]MBP6605520.1 flagellar basal body-associated FliL family protein [Nitrospira sp.]MCI1278887.1 flagellar basal body-associated FliL family protein [Nitrospira sp.]HQY57564.1 flagellar basal body-associated FliL family protein [Nitrospira sp.]HRA95447.1 flagellar basal body-associated FliL family protein [Nitrospira sp.]